ncbi:hypothetical protein TrST_g991 [Triparma strigata]|uniref:Cyclopropane-fatty-acyl-phospholipid synthase n=1 Tax=Triparma strigata TaxID=1606541 RepID=A0A9W7C5A8_9STRA|nr:hypothetical protein TrST_g991 [Triparma strigata]
MVFNERNYPNLIKFFNNIDVQAENSDMSLSITLTNPSSTFCSSSIFSNLMNLLSPTFYVMISDILFFNKDVKRYMEMEEDDPSRFICIREYLKTEKYSEAFTIRYLLPLCCAIWSISIDEVLSFPVLILSSFLTSHSMLTFGEREQWLTVKGRSRRYVEKVVEEVEGKGGRVVVKEVTRVERLIKKDGVSWEIFSGTLSLGTFSKVIFAVPPPLAYKLLSSDPKISTMSCLKNVEYVNNSIYVHNDDSYMPPNKYCWGAWNCKGDYVRLKEKIEGKKGGKRMEECGVTYWLNRLQNLKTETNFFVTLNPPTPPPNSTLLTLPHPVFNSKTLSSVNAVKSLNGKDGLFFCGAWGGYGFHEDGLKSGIEVARLIDNNVPEPESVITAPTSPSYLTLLSTFLTKTLPYTISKKIVIRYLKKYITIGRINLILPSPDKVIQIGVNDGTSVLELKVFSNKFFVNVVLGADLGLSKSYGKGLFKIVNNKKKYGTDRIDDILGDVNGLKNLFRLFIKNRDKGKASESRIMTGAGLFFSWVGRTIDMMRYTSLLDNSERGGSRENIHAHYDLSNDLFMSFLDDETRMYSSAVFDGQGMGGTLAEAQNRKLDILCERAGLDASVHLLDIGFGWGGLSIHAAKKYCCKVTGITLSVEQNALATERVKAMGLGHLIEFEIVDYRTFAKRKENKLRFDRVISCEMIEAVGHNHLGEFFDAVQKVLKPSGCLVMEAICTPESRYEEYRKSTDFINSVIFPGSCCPSLHALVDAAYVNAPSLRLQKIEDYGIHYAETLKVWRSRFNANIERVRELGFDDEFMRLWNYYFAYCEAGFESETENLLVLVFGAPGWKRQRISEK